MENIQNLMKDVESGAQPPIGRTSRAFYIDDDVYEWLKDKYGATRHVSYFVRTVLRKCMESDKANQGK